MTEVLRERIDEDLALVEELLALSPAGSEDWRPGWPGETPFTLGDLSAHLTDSCAGLAACFGRLHPELGWTKDPAATIGTYRTRLREGFALTQDADLMRVIPTYFVPAGEPFLKILLVNLKHVNHHAHQLFTYLKLLGVPVGTRHLYRFR